MATMFPLILAFTLAESLGDSMLADSDVANESETELIPRCWTPDTLTGNYSAAHARLWRRRVPAARNAMRRTEKTCACSRESGPRNACPTFKKSNDTCRQLVTFGEFEIKMNHCRGSEGLLSCRRCSKNHCKGW